MILVSDWLAFHADRTPDKLAMIDQGTGRRFTYAEFNDRSTRLASTLRDVWGAKAGDRLAILAKNSVEYYEFQFACFKLGAIMLPLNWRLAEPELLFILNDAGAMGLVYDNEFFDRISPLMEKSPLAHTLRIDLGQAANDATPGYAAAIIAGKHDVFMNPQTSHDTPVTIMYTSGTTGHPKGVIITQGMTFWNAINISVPTGLNRDTVYYMVLPTFHTAGLNLYANPIIHWGGTNIIAREFDPELTLKTLADDDLGVTHFFGVPAIYLFLSQHADFEKTDLSRIRSWGCGGAPLPVSLLETYGKRGITIQLGFGMTETSPTVFLIAQRRVMDKPTSVGKPMLHTQVRVVNDDFKDVAVGQVGEVVISGPNVTPEYWNRPDANEDGFTVDEHGNRWIHSGDAGMVDEDGCIYIVDRYKDMYISGGENVYPAEVEQVIFKLPEVGDVGVIGIPDERWGESGLAAVVLKPDAALSPQTIIEHCGKNLARYKVPKAVAFVDELPRNASGKVLKRTLRERYMQGDLKAEE
jgi:fatty-acyl-CoA synthase